MMELHKFLSLVDIDEIKLDVDPDHDKDIVLDDNYTLRLKYPSLGQFIKSNFNETDVSVEDTFELVADCIEQVFSPEESFLLLTVQRKN